MKYFTLILALLPTLCLGQKYQWEAPLDTPKASGFHRIELSPAITCQLNDGLTDIRIFDENGAQVPYLHEQDEVEWRSQVFRQHPIVERIETKGMLSGIVIGNPARKVLDNFYLEVKNADVRKAVRLRGSMDGKAWFAIKEDYLFRSFVSPHSPNKLQLIRFPKSDYPYFKLEFGDYRTAPLHILQVGYYDTNYERGRYLEVPKPQVSQKDSSDQSSWIHLQWQGTPHLDMLQLDIDGPAFYYRKVDLVKRVYQKNGKSNMRYVRTFHVGSNLSNTIYLSNFNLNDYWLVVHNDDNPPLKIKGVRGFQLHRYLTAHLEGDQHYKLRFGRENDRAPVYDLAYFRSSIPSHPASLTVGTPILANGEIKAGPRDRKTVWIWVVIGVVAVALAAMSFKMIRELSPTESA